MYAVKLSAGATRVGFGRFLEPLAQPTQYLEAVKASRYALSFIGFLVNVSRAYLVTLTAARYYG